MNFVVTVFTQQNTLLGFLSRFVYACLTYMKIFFRWVSVMKCQCTTIPTIPAQPTFSSMFGNKYFFDALSFKAGRLSYFDSIHFVIATLIFHCTLFAAITSTIFGRLISVKIGERLDDFTIGAFAS